MQQQRAKGTPISGPLLQEKALMFAKELYPDSHHKFKASNGWLTRFKGRHASRSVTLQGESLSANTDAVASFKTKLQKIIAEEGLTRDQLFNADETGLWWYLMPNRTLVLHGETTAKNFKMAKDRVTVLGCANAIGTCKIPLAFIHKSAKPRCFKHDNMEDLPVHYYSQHNAWMDAFVFKKWFNDKFVPFVRRFCRRRTFHTKSYCFLIMRQHIHKKQSPQIQRA
ncbi:jerky protein homolog-like [Anneissia japonica]|uniref:jerky protein homolog-like n=1 Tax=Anneissia japonica TaxID=1529436 RepID=UPI0014254FDB|nr:jerky protein homolog-like [Anneissia japonica]